MIKKKMAISKKPRVLLSSSRLALEGGKPLRKTWLAYGRQSIDASDIKAVSKVLRSDMITRGPAVTAFEEACAELAQMPYAVAFTSATAGLHAVMAMIGVGPGKKVLTSPITFAATTNAVLYCQGTPIFKDVEPTTMNLNPETLGDLSQILAVVAVDFAGNPCDYAALKKLQASSRFRLIADAAHSLGGSLNGKPVGSLADISVLSFHPVKSITTGEGGMVLVRDAKEAEFLRQFRGHGIVRSPIPGYYRQEFLGYNYHMTDLQAALGVSQLKKLKRFIKKRESLVQRYNRFFSQFREFVEVPQVTPGGRSAWHLYPLRLHLDKLKVDRTMFLKALHAENIGANVHYIPVYRHPYYEGLGFRAGLCAIAEAQYAREISLPLFVEMTDRDLKDTCLAVEKIITHSAR